MNPGCISPGVRSLAPLLVPIVSSDAARVAAAVVKRRPSFIRREHHVGHIRLVDDVVVDGERHQQVISEAVGRRGWAARQAAAGRDGEGPLADPTTRHDRGEAVDDVVVLSAVQLVVRQRVFVSGDQLALAYDTSEAFDMVDLLLGAHHQIVRSKAGLAAITLDRKQSAVYKHTIK